MIKKILFFIFFILFFTQATFAQEVFRVTSVNFDTSKSLIFITSPDNTTEAILKKVKLTRLQNPKRVYFDINSAVLATAPQNWFLNSGGVKQIKVNQFSSNPSKVRVVLYLDEAFNESKINFIKVNNNIVIQFKGGMNSNQYFQSTYRDEKVPKSDFFQNLTISNEDIEQAKIAINANTKDAVLNQIQQAFNDSTAPSVAVQPVGTKQTAVIKKELKLKSKFYLNSISPKANGFLISGFGAIGIEKPIYLTNPARVIFDIPNAIINSDLKNQDYKVGKDSIKISQFNQNIARLTVTTNELEKYFPIYSSDGQSILFVNSEDFDTTSLFSKTTDATSYCVKKIGANTQEFIMYFNSPVVHSVKRDNSKLTINFFNALRYNDKNFKNTVKYTDLTDMKIDLLDKVGLKLTLPLEKSNVVNCFLGADGKSIKITVRGLKPRHLECPQESSMKTTLYEKNIGLPKCKGKKSVVLDAGHGGSDYGAIRSGINEKDINLDVTKRVQAMLMSKGVTVYMTRSTDDFVSLSDRSVITNNKSPDIFVSIHVNSASSPDATGLETHYYHPNSTDLAKTVHTSLTSYISSKDRGLIKSRFYVINHTEVPAILVEIGFISNSAERASLVSESRKQETAKAISEGILKYLNGN